MTSYVTLDVHMREATTAQQPVAEVHAVRDRHSRTHTSTRRSSATTWSRWCLGIADSYSELAPASETAVVFRDSAFADDLAKGNLAAILE